MPWMKMEKQGVDLATVFIFIVLFTGTEGRQVEPCPSGWKVFDKEISTLCLHVSGDTQYWTKANGNCIKMNATLFKPDTEAKYTFFKELATTRSSSEGLIIPLVKFTNGLQWLTKDGNPIPVTSLPKALEEFSGWYSRDHQSNKEGLVFHSTNNLNLFSELMGYPYYVCEKRANCSKGWWGLGCDKECRCYAQDCHPLAVTMTCHYGCQLGWMGKDCSRRKLDADVRYFCVDSPDQGKYAHIRIATKGVKYENIHAVDHDGHWVPWCNNTRIHIDSLLDIVSIKVYVDVDTKRKIRNGSCAGKVSQNGNIEWRLRIQEKGGIVSRNDQEVNIECDFDEADNFHVTGETEIKRESDFLPSDIKRPIENLEEMKETVELSMVDPYDGRQISENRIGTSVVLKITYGVGEDDLATGVIPYDCFASSPDFKKNATFLDEHGCPCEDFPISAFSKNDSTSLITKPFPLFGFEGNEDVEFHCSYVLCFGNDPCPVGCNKESDYKHAISHRPRRSTRAQPLKLVGAV